MKDGVNHYIEVWLLVADVFEQVLVDGIEGAGVDFCGNGGMPFRPPFEDVLEIRAPFDGFL